MNKEEKKLTEIFQQISAQGRVDLLSHANTVLRAENNIKKAMKVALPSAQGQRSA
ncbi:MAG: hypothetical protein LBF78_07095 [Treponema sp.]|jgi:hypothetical protein|nr:hypothetical protein [Treponema sp.]